MSRHWRESREVSGSSIGFALAGGALLAVAVLRLCWWVSELVRGAL